jgi:Tfp pilus assembly protein FimT
MELIVVLAVLLLLATFAVPSLVGLKGNSDQQAAASTIQARLADARRLAMEQGVAYRLAVDQSGTKVRLAPDDANFAAAAAANVPTGAARVIEMPLENATAGCAADPDAGDAGQSPAADGSGWNTVATFLPDGTCREDRVLVEVNEAGFPPIRILVRGVSGTSRVLPRDSQGGALP